MPKVPTLMSNQCYQCLNPMAKGTMHTCHLNMEGAAIAQSQGFGSLPAPQGDHEIEKCVPACFDESKAFTVPGRSKGGRPKGFSGTRSKMPSALAIAFKKAGLDWRQDFALAIKTNNRNRIKLWLKLLPYMITTSAKSRVKKWKGKPSRAAMIALETLEGKNE